MKKRLFIFLFLVPFSMFCISCAAALVGGAFYKTSKTREQKQKLVANYNQTNLEREKVSFLLGCSTFLGLMTGWA